MRKSQAVPAGEAENGDGPSGGMLAAKVPSTAKVTVAARTPPAKAKNWSPEWTVLVAEPPNSQQRQLQQPEQQRQQESGYASLKEDAAADTDASAFVPRHTFSKDVVGDTMTSVKDVDAHAAAGDGHGSPRQPVLQADQVVCCS